ncbi:MAG: beta-ketoacyl-[acyl-carrier-protein] synthase family protein [Candidatus Tectomicrobia bacterium]|nr:beta-ketoacyl-[acyl-carrier-protein] synthase family protein [Candidatus Tectomicrobia bacterium]
MQTERPRVVITGMHLITPFGDGIEAFWHGLLSAKSAIAPITSFEPAGFRTPIAGEIPPGDRARVHAEAAWAGMDETSKLGLWCAAEAVRHAGLSVEQLRAANAGCSIASLGGEEREGDYLAGEPWQACPAPAVLERSYHLATVRVARLLRLPGPCVAFTNACIAGTTAIGFGLDTLRAGHSSIFVAGAVSDVSRLEQARFDALRALTAGTYCPFDRRRSGLLLGEAGAVLILETYDSARRRGAAMQAEILGYGQSCDASSITRPNPTGAGLARAMRAALDDAAVRADEIDYINAHGTGTRHNDSAETRAVKTIFGRRARAIPISTIKPFIGHTTASASAVELIACILSLQHGMVPPTLNYAEPDKDCDLDYVPNLPRRAELRIAMSNSAGFGGSNASIIVAGSPRDRERPRRRKGRAREEG